MKKIKLFSFVALVGLFTYSPVYSTAQSKMSHAPLADECMYFQAEKEGRVLHFIPSHHYTPVSDLPQLLQDDLKTYERVTLECSTSI